MNSLQLTTSITLRPFADFLTRHGEDVSNLLREAGLPSNCLDNPKTLIPTFRIWRFRELAAIRTGLPDFILKVMAPFDITELGTAGSALVRAPTLMRMLRDFCRVSRTLSSTALFGITACPAGGVLFWNRFTRRHQHAEWHGDLYILMVMLKIIRLVAPGWSPNEIRLMSRATRDRASMIESLSKRPCFGEPFTGFLIPGSMLALPGAHRESSPRNACVDEQSVQSMALLDTAAGTIRKLIRSYASDGWLTLNDAADAAGTSQRTLQRNLSAEGTTFREVQQETRAEMAADMLANTTATMSEIGEHLGYSTQGNFTRAFRRWASVSPTEFRVQGQRPREVRRHS
ncbi:MAG: helix-turn-helix transcriptional regulator [Planctomycetota bacterium]|jgi:AraC-like DNA-binding protein